MQTDFDVVIVGSGPAGVSVAFPLVRSGLKVLMVDGGREEEVAPPSLPFLEGRSKDVNQWKWLVGEKFHALKHLESVSPKLRMPSHAYVFDKFTVSNPIDSTNFIAVGSLAKGGLSNAWGAGVARLSGDELLDFPFSESEIFRSYESVTRRIGVSGANNDDLSEYFGLDAWAQPPIGMDSLHAKIFAQYALHREKLASRGFRLGRARMAVISENLADRKACDILGNCLIGCHRRAIYSAGDEVFSLLKYKNFYYQSGFIIDEIESHNGIASARGQYKQTFTSVTAKKIALAAGTLATTRLALMALRLTMPISLQSCPTAAFLLWLPSMLGTQRINGFGLGQLAFSLSLTPSIKGYGATFSTCGIPVNEFVRHMPFAARYGIDFARNLLSSCLVGNIFLPGHLSSTVAQIDANGILKIIGGYSDQVDSLLLKSSRRLRKAYRQIGAVVVPRSFIAGQPGADIHYSSTLPMRLSPTRGETNAQGEILGLENVHIVDGACLSTLPQKPHTLTIMANADRIGQKMASQLLTFR